MAEPTSETPESDGKSWLNCPLCPLKQGGDINGCCVALRAALRKAAQQNQD
jgi:hypothetical protein